MPLPPWPPKDPNEVEDFDLIWTPRLAGDTIVTSIWSIPPGSALSINSNSFITSPTSSISKVWLSGGILNQTYTLTNTITTAFGETMVETVQILVQAK